MKARYDNHVIDRKFKQGDKVLALLPIPGRPLQARYFGPYTIDKKTSDLNYIVNTPGRRKNKQMCHVNMLKQYFDRDSSSVLMRTLGQPFYPIFAHFSQFFQLRTTFSNLLKILNITDISYNPFIT